MALEYVVTKRVFGFDDTKTEKYVAKSVRSGQMSFSKTCAKVSRLCGVHRKVVDLVVSGLVDMMAEDIDDGKSVQLGEFGIFRPTIKAKSANTAEGVTATYCIHSGEDFPTYFGRNERNPRHSHRYRLYGRKQFRW